MTDQSDDEYNNNDNNNDNQLDDDINNNNNNNNNNDMNNNDNNNDDNPNQINPGGFHLSINNDENTDYENGNASDDDERNKAGLNSPKAKPNPVSSLNINNNNNNNNDNTNNNNNNNNININNNHNSTNNKHLGLALNNNDEQQNDGDVTPNTKRDQMGINSPRAKKQSGGWLQALETNQDNNNMVTNDGGMGGGGIESLVTQVQRPITTSNNDELTQNIITQVSADDNTESELQSKVPEIRQKSFCDCLVYCFTCCSSQTPQKQPIGLNDMSKDDGNHLQSKTNGNHHNTNNMNPNKTNMNHNNMNNNNNNMNINNNSNNYSNIDNKRLLTNSNQHKTNNINSNNNDENYPINNNNNNTKDGMMNNSNSNKKNEESEDSSTDYGDPLLPPPKNEDIGKKCLVLDLDETLVHSSFKPIPKPDFIIPVEIDRVVHHVYVLKRPFVDDFLLRVSKYYEIVVFTASLSKYADPLLDKLDIHNVISHRLFRESCVIHGTAYVKDLRKLGRKLKNSIIVDNSPPSYLFQPTNAVPITSWFDDPRDTQLLDFCGVLETTLKNIDDVRKVLDANNKTFRWLCNQANKPLEIYE